ncbi:MAG: hypothetical protein ACOCVG_04200, partial [Verrucomicrobiota bacterium]
MVKPLARVLLGLLRLGLGIGLLAQGALLVFIVREDRLPVPDELLGQLRTLLEAEGLALEKGEL